MTPDSTRSTSAADRRAAARAIALVVLALPIVLVAVMGFRYFSAPVFLAATLAVLAAGVAMTASSLRLLRHDAR